MGDKIMSGTDFPFFIIFIIIISFYSDVMQPSIITALHTVIKLTNFTETRIVISERRR